ncbi:MAG: cytochrome c [Xanthobacteraceae bacterium]|nr:cytochrome c [Xanthobacteraceae bacterium]
MLRWIVALAAVAAAGPAAAQSASVARGDYLANTIMTCANCHSPKGPPAATAGKDYSGGLRFNEPPFDVTASNITPDKETGIGSWSDAQIKAAILTGKRPSGVPLAEVMPTSFYPILTDGDANALVAYLKSLPPVKNKVPDPVYKIALPHHIFPGAEKAYAPADLNDKVRKGFYLATIGHCMECHTPFVQGGGGLDVANSLGKGGREFPGPWGVSKSRNITSSKTAGLGNWTDAEIKSAITQGKSRDGSPLKGPMGYQYYAKMTDADLDAVVAYLRTVPAKD